MTMTGPQGPAGPRMPPPLLDMDPEQPLTPKELAAVVGIEARTVQRWCKDGLIPARRVGLRQWKIYPALLKERNPDLWEEYLDASERQKRH